MAALGDNGLRIGALAALALAGCISTETPGGLPPMCETTDDCASAQGEVCDEGVCWGDPPAHARFAAMLVPPAERADLPVATLPVLSIAENGDIIGLVFPEAVTVHGRVLLACPNSVEATYPCGPDASVAAQILVERAPTFTGGPAFSRSVVATAGVEAGKDGFSFLLPRDPEAEYRVTIQPDDTVGGDQVSPGEIAPPRQLVVRADRSQEVQWYIGEPSQLKLVRGCVQNVLGEGAPYAGMKVVALGRWTQLSPLERASSRSVTDEDGCFELSVPRDMLDEFDIAVQPIGAAVQPSFTLRGEFVRDPAEGEETVHVIDPPIVMPVAPAPAEFRLPIEAQASAGGQEPVGSADVRLATVFQAPSLNLERDVDIRFEADAVTSEDGVAEVELYPGDETNRRYVVTVVPPAGSPFQSTFEREVWVGIGGAGDVLEALSLERRAAVTGRITLASGEPVEGAQIEARPSVLFRQALGEEERAELAALPIAIATTDADGQFLLWLDRQLVGREASYDIEVTPPLLSGAPGWSFEDTEVPDSGDLKSRALPEASYARATVFDARRRVVPGAELHVFQLPPDDYCAQAATEPPECQPPAVLRGVWQSDEAGLVRVVLPDP
jgi:hypothetical protein